LLAKAISSRHPFGDSGSAARFFYCAKASKRDRNEGLDGFEAKNNGKMMRNANNTSEEPSVGFERFATEPSANHHPTVKPTDLMRYLCRLITPPNGTVLDPFMGSGSTGKAAMYEGFKFIGVEMTDEYLPIAKARIEFAVSDNEGFLL
jgi:site-specific DNA-methyltransferase (adenine-specific)